MTDGRPDRSQVGHRAYHLGDAADGAAGAAKGMRATGARDRAAHLRQRDATGHLKHLELLDFETSEQLRVDKTLHGSLLSITLASQLADPSNRAARSHPRRSLTA